VTEVAIREENNVAHVPAQRAAVAPAVSAPSALVQWAEDARTAAGIATSLAQTSFVPTAFRGKIPEITAVILAGQELGLPPVAALRSMDVIQGTPALRAHAMRGLVQSKGHKVQLLESDDRHCVMRGKRAGDEEWQTVTWTFERAAKLGLTGKDQWRKQPQTMLEARATGTVCRLIASDVLFAMPYAAEELDGAEAPDGSSLVAPRVTVEEILERPDALREENPAHRELATGADPSTACGYCMEPGHFEDDCPQRGGASDGAEF
jgi:hypothetical protein